MTAVLRSTLARPLISGGGLPLLPAPPSVRAPAAEPPVPGGWVEAFFDNFGGGVLDTAKWKTTRTGAASNGAYSFDATGVAVSDGLLVRCFKSGSAWFAGGISQGGTTLGVAGYGDFQLTVKARAPAGQGVSLFVAMTPADGSAVPVAMALETPGKSKQTASASWRWASGAAGISAGTYPTDLTQDRLFTVRRAGSAWNYWIDGEEQAVPVEWAQHADAKKLVLGIGGFVASAADTAYGGPPDGTTPSPWEARVSYVRVHVPLIAGGGNTSPGVTPTIALDPEQPGALTEATTGAGASRAVTVTTAGISSITWVVVRADNSWREPRQTVATNGTVSIAPTYYASNDFLKVLKADDFSVFKDGGPVTLNLAPVPAQPAGTDAQVAQQFVAPLTAGMNIERGNAWGMSYNGASLQSSTAYWNYLRGLGCTHVRLFYPWRISADMLGDGTHNGTPSDGQIGRILDATAVAVSTGLKVFLDATDVFDYPEMDSNWGRVSGYLDRFAGLVASRNLSALMVCPGAFNELSGETNATWNHYRVEAHRIFRNRLPQHVLCTGSANWNHHETLVAPDWQMTPDARVVAQWHSYDGDQSAGHWQWVRGNMEAFSARNGGIPTIGGEAGYGGWFGDEDISDAERFTDQWATNFRTQAANAGLERPVAWCVTGGTAWRANRGENDPTLRPAIEQSYRDADAIIKGLSGWNQQPGPAPTIALNPENPGTLTETSAGAGASRAVTVTTTGLASIDWVVVRADYTWRERTTVATNGVVAINPVWRASGDFLKVLKTGDYAVYKDGGAVTLNTAPGTGGGSAEGVFFEDFNGPGTGLLPHNWGDVGQISVSGGTCHIGGSYYGTGVQMFCAGPSTCLGNGLFEIRAQLLADTKGDGSGPALVLWPASDVWPGPEIDIGEVNDGGQTYFATHWRGDDGNDYANYYVVNDVIPNFNQRDPHTYAARLANDRITYTVDGTVIGVETQHPAPDFANGGENHSIGFMNRSSDTAVRVDWCRWTPEGTATGGNTGGGNTGGGGGTAPPPTAVDAEYPAYSGGSPLAVGKAGLLFSGQSNMGYLFGEGVWHVNIGLAAALGVAQGYYNPQITGLDRLDAYGLVAGSKSNPEVFTIVGGNGLYTAGGRAATFLDPFAGGSSSNWPYGAAGYATQRFIRDIMTADERASCYGVWTLHSENDSRDLGDGEYEEYLNARLNWMAKVRSDFGRPATGANGLPFFYVYPIPFGGNGQALVRRAWNAIISNPANNAHLVVGQTCDSLGGLRWGATSRDYDHRSPEDLTNYARRSVFGVLRVLNSQRGVGNRNLPSFGPKMVHAFAEGATSTVVTVAHDRGTALRLGSGAGDGRGWNVFDNGADRPVSGVAILNATQLRLTHAAAGLGAAQRAVAYTLFGQELGQGGAIYDNYGSLANPSGWPSNWGPEWHFDFPLRGSLVPMASSGSPFSG